VSQITDQPALPRVSFSYATECLRTEEVSG